MAEQVQSILEQMVPHLKDLRTRGLFSNDEVRSIVDRRRQSEYLLQRRSASRKSDYLRYIEDELLLERLRKLRKEKVLTEMRNERMEMERRRREGEKDGSDDESEDLADVKRRHHAYQTSGPGDSHIIAHIHFLYQRTLKKFHYPIDVLLNYAQYAKDFKSFHKLSRIYAEGLQHHPRESGLWIEAASFEYFGYVAQDYENDSKSGTKNGGGGVNSKVVGSSIANARVLMQRGLRINKTSVDLWLQYFALELHYVQKLRGRREILEGAASDGQESSDDEEGGTVLSTSLLPSQIIYKNAIKAVPSDIQFRLRFVEACRMFPQTTKLESYIMEGVTKDFGESVEGWVARISYVEEQWRKKGAKKAVGFLGNEEDDGSEDDGEERPTKKARVVESDSSKTSDPALDLLQEALATVSTPKMFLEGARFLRLRIQRLLDHDDNEEDEDDVSYLIGKGEDAKGAAQHHVGLLEELYDDANKKNASSTNLTLDHVDYLLGSGYPDEAEQLLSNAFSATATNDAKDVRLWLKWAEVSQQMEESASDDTMTTPSASPTRILRRALKNTPLHDRHAHTLILTELMKCLMMPPASPKVNEELKSLFQKLILLSQGSGYSMPNKSSQDDNDDDDEEEVEQVNAAATFLAYLKYTMPDGDAKEEGGAIDIRSIYTSVLHHSNYGKSCLGKTEEEVHTMKSFFDVCLQYEKTKKDQKEKKKVRKMRLSKLYEVAIGFYESGGSTWRNVVDGYQRDLNDVKYSF